MEDLIDVTRNDTAEVPWSSDVPSKPDWIVEMNSELSHEVNLIPKIEEMCVKVFQKLSAMLSDRSYTDGNLILSIKGSSPLRKIVESYIGNADEKTAESLKHLLGSSTLKAADWDSDIVIHPDLDAESSSLLRAYIDHCVLTSFQYMQELFEQTVLPVIQSRLTDIAKKDRDGGRVKWVYRRGVDVLMKNQDQNIPREGKTTLLVHSDHGFFPMLSSPHRQLIGFGAFESPKSRSLKVTTMYHLVNLLQDRPQKYSFDKTSIFYVTRNRGIWDGHKGFDIYRSFLSATFPDKDNKRCFVRAELIDISVAKGPYYREQAFRRRQHQMTWNGLPIMNWSAFYEDILLMTQSALDKDGAVLPDYVFKFEKRKRRLEFLQELMRITGVRMDHVFAEAAVSDEDYRALEDIFLTIVPSATRPSEYIKDLQEHGIIPAVENPYRHILALFLSQSDFKRFLSKAQRYHGSDDYLQKVLAYYMNKARSRRDSGNMLFLQDDVTIPRHREKTMRQGPAVDSAFMKYEEV